MSFIRRDIARELAPLVCSMKERYKDKNKELLFVAALTECFQQGKLKSKEYEKVLSEFYFFPESLDLKFVRVLEDW